MTPPNWDHVTHELTRRVLTNELDDDASVSDALVFANDCLNADHDNDEVSDKMLSARGKAFEVAELRYDADDLTGCVRALRRFWSV